MPRLPRPDYEHTYHHVIVRGVDGLPIFDTPHKKQTYINLMNDARETHDLSVYALGFVDNHVHQFIRRNQQSMGIFYRRVNGRYGSWYNKKFKRTGALYDSRYYSTLVDSDAYFDAVWRYTHHQGVKAGLYDEVQEDPWSSAGVYLEKSSHFEWIDWQEAIVELGVESRRETEQILQRKGEETKWYGEENFPYEMYRGQRFLADTAFIEKHMQIRKENVREKPREETPIKWKKLLETAQEISGLSKKELVTPSQKQERVKHRSGLAYACRRYGHMTLSEIGDQLKVSSPTVSVMIKRTKQRYTSLKNEWEQSIEQQKL